ncbi:hypothetical protein DTW90_20555 [Neorhizobium sp. P12A]|uniref:hypothetical protein n=1 Tax=Rhizobium/Agrobacterium group TaxID=227290 RepID=UPI00104BA3AD|nr:MULTISPECIES: hypothetical protein [Rhizobium/Agrobacterium group]KAA0697155.1 hypothetical protein DTW90_20555 [Neorhizobium sp. P12A]TCR85997.1 hypothetical protein EV561_106259 [Rhizobium sp. BK376]
MNSGGNSTHLSVLETVEAHFPDQKRLVQRLFYVNEAFHSMCEDLAAAIDALAHVERLPDNLREMRRQEYAALVDALLKEMREALAQSKIVMLKPPDARPKSP